MLLKINVNDSVCTIDWLIEIAVLETRPTLYVFVKCLVFVLIFQVKENGDCFKDESMQVYNKPFHFLEKNCLQASSIVKDKFLRKIVLFGCPLPNIS